MVTSTAPSAPLLLADGARVVVDGVVVFDTLSFRTRGERVVLCGDYSPILRVLMGGGSPATARGSARVVAGKLELAGVDVAHGAHATSLGVAFFDAPLPDGWTATRYLEWSARLGGVASKEARLRAEQSLELVGAQALAGRALRGLGVLERRLLGLAHAVVNLPSVLVCEDPLAGLDADGVECVRQAIASSTSGRAALVLLPRVTLAGPTAELVTAATHLVSLAHGRIVFDGAPTALAAGARLFAVTACGGVARFREELLAVGAEVSGSSHQFSVALPEGLAARDIVGAAARAGAGLLGCSPVT